MANSFQVSKSQGVTTVTTVYTAPASTTSIVLQLDVANVHATLSSDVSVEHVTSATGTFIAKVIPVAVGATLEVSSGKKIVLEASDFLRVTATNTVDVTVSVLEQT